MWRVLSAWLIFGFDEGSLGRDTNNPDWITAVGCMLQRYFRPGEFTALADHVINIQLSLRDLTKDNLEPKGFSSDTQSAITNPTHTGTGRRLYLLVGLKETDLGAS